MITRKKMIKKTVFLLLSLSSWLVISCATANSVQENLVLSGRVADSQGNPVSGFQLSIGEGSSVVSGINGMFAISDVKKGEYHLEGFKKGYIPLNENISFNDNRSILMVKVEDCSVAYSQIEKYLRNGEPESAEKLLLSLKKGNEQEVLFNFYENLTAFIQGIDKEKHSEKMLEIIRSVEK